MMRPGEGILSYPKNQGRRPSDLPLNVLREFQEFEKTLGAAMESYEGRGEAVTYAMQSFTQIEIFAIALMMEDDEYAAARRCHDDIMKLFRKDSAFDDGISLMSWLIFNFPTSRGGKALATKVLKKNPKLKASMGPFVEEAVNSRLGLYVVVKDLRDSCQVTELFTGRELTIGQSLGGMGRGSIALVRVMNIMGKLCAFGDAHEFPAAKKSAIYNMVADKMSLYFGGEDEVSCYDTMMRLAGPYWFSIAARDYQGDILNPDHYLRYYRDDGKSASTRRQSPDDAEIPS